MTARRTSTEIAAVSACSAPVDQFAGAGAVTAAAPGPATGDKLCSRCHEWPAIPNRPGPARCAECAANPRPRQPGRRYRDNQPRARTIGRAELRREVRLNAAVEPGKPLDIPRPQTWGECREQARPCPWVGCKHHIYLDVDAETGSVKLNFPHLEVWELRETCSLDVAERGGVTLEDLGALLNVTRERARQLEVHGLLKLKMGSPSPDEIGADLLAGAAVLASGDQP